MIIGEIIKRNARRYPQKTAVVFEDTRYSFKEFNNRVNSLTNALSDMGVRKGDRVAVLLDNCHQYIELYCVSPKGGTVLVPLNCRLSQQELDYIINSAEASTLFLGENYLGLVNSMRRELKGVRNFIVIGAAKEGMRSYEELVALYPATEPEVDVAEDDLAYLLHTGGTTGLPKGAMLSHRGMTEIALNSIFAYRLTPDDIGLLAFPAFWGAIELFILPWFYMGCPIVVVKEFEPKAVLKTIEREKITASVVTPANIMSLLECPEIDKCDLRSLRCLLFGSAPTAGEILRRAIGIFGNIFSQVYGLIETGWLACLPPEAAALDGPPEKVRRLRSCGREIINVEVRVVSEDGNDVPPGEVGEVIAKGDNLMKGYWKLPQATAEALRGGYLYTGDLATMDEEGYIYLVGRKKDVITSGERSIYATEVEEVLYRHPSVLEAAIIGVPDAELGESVKAVIVLRQGDRATEEEIIEFCRPSLANCAIPRSVEFVDKLPRSAAGKILKRELRERYCRSS